MAHIFSESLVVSPFTIIVDTREQVRYDFDAIPARLSDGGGSVVTRVVRRALKSGDYSIEGMENRVVVERKSLADLYGTLGCGRNRFMRELERLAELEYAAVVVEGSWEQIVDPKGDDPIWFAKLEPRSVWGTVFAWSQRYPTIDWFPMGARSLAEFATYEILERFWRDHQPERNSSGE